MVRVVAAPSEPGEIGKLVVEVLLPPVEQIEVLLTKKEILLSQQQ